MAFIVTGFVLISLGVFTFFGLVEFMFVAIFLMITFLVFAIVEFVFFVVIIFVGFLVISSRFMALLMEFFVTLFTACINRSNRNFKLFPKKNEIGKLA